MIPNNARGVVNRNVAPLPHTTVSVTVGGVTTTTRAPAITVQHASSNSSSVPFRRQGPPAATAPTALLSPGRMPAPAPHALPHVEPKPLEQKIVLEEPDSDDDEPVAYIKKKGSQEQETKPLAELSDRTSFLMNLAGVRMTQIANDETSYVETDYDKLEIVDNKEEREAEKELEMERMRKEEIERATLLSRMDTMKTYDPGMPEKVDLSQKMMAFKKSFRELTITAIQQKRRGMKKWDIFVEKVNRSFLCVSARRMFAFARITDRIIWIIERSFGTGIASFYEFWIGVIKLNIFLFLVNFFALMLPWLIAVRNFTELGGSNVGDFFIGLTGFSSKVIGKSWFYYGGYPPIQGIYDFGFAYSLCIILCYLISLIHIVYNIGKRLRMVTDVDKSLKYGTVVLNTWDFSLSRQGSVDDLRNSMTSRLKELLVSDRLEAEETKSWTVRQKIVFVIRRTIGYTVSAVVLIASPVCVYFISANYNLLNSFFPFTASTLMSAINILFPMVLTLMVKLEGYTDQKYFYWNDIVRTYFVKMTTSITMIINVFSLDDSALKAVGKCAANEAGIVFWQVLVIDLVVSSILTILTNVIMRVVTRKRQEFPLSANVISLLYTQAILWIGSLMCPMLSFLGIITNFILFLVKSTVMRLTMKFPDKPVTNAKSSPFFFVCLLVTLYLSAIPTIIFLSLNMKGKSCGPHTYLPSDTNAVTSTGIAAITSYFTYVITLVLSFIPGSSSISNYLTIAVDTITNRLLLLAVMLVIVTIAHFAVQRMRMYQEKLRRTLERLQKEREEKLKLLKERLKAASKKKQ